MTSPGSSPWARFWAGPPAPPKNGARSQHVGFSLEAIPIDLRWIENQKGVPLRGRHDDTPQLIAKIGERHVGQHRDAAIHDAPGGRGACPVAADDLARVEFDRIGDAAKPSMVLDTFIEFTGVGSQR